MLETCRMSEAAPVRARLRRDLHQRALQADAALILALRTTSAQRCAPRPKPISATIACAKRAAPATPAAKPPETSPPATSSTTPPLPRLPPKQVAHDAGSQAEKRAYGGANLLERERLREDAEAGRLHGFCPLELFGKARHEQDLELRLRFNGLLGHDDSVDTRHMDVGYEHVGDARRRLELLQRFGAVLRDLDGVALRLPAPA